MFFGRKQEIDKLLDIIEPDGLRVSFLYGIPGSGKSALLQQFGYDAERLGARVVSLDCRMIEPTPQGLLAAICPFLDDDAAELGQIAASIHELDQVVIFCLDHYETFQLLDTWVRKELMVAIPDSCRLVIASRRPPVAQWLISPLYLGSTQVLTLGPLQHGEALEMLHHLGGQSELCDMIIAKTHGNPLALKLAAAATKVKASLSGDIALQDVMQELTEIYLAEVTDTDTRVALEQVSVARRITKSLLRALPDVDDVQFSNIQKLPFVDSWPDGLRIHHAVHEAIISTLRATDPERYFSTRKAAWKQLCNEMHLTPHSNLWRATADMLFLIENPIIREAFFPSCDQEFAVEKAEDKDWEQIEQIIKAHDGAAGVVPLKAWWQMHRAAFHVVRDPQGDIQGFYCMEEAGKISPNIIESDPITSAWISHVYESSPPEHSRTLFLRRWLTPKEGEAPSPGQAACWLDVKRSYMELRPALRKVYLTVVDLPMYASIASQLGFEHLPQCSLRVGNITFHTAMLDFGPKSVDGWITKLVGDEMGISHECPIDKERRTLIINSEEIELTPLEYNLATYLESKPGQTVTRDELLTEVWGYVDGIGSSNVVDAVVRTLRKKLGPLSGHVETVRGFGYRWQIPL